MGEGEIGGGEGGGLRGERERVRGRECARSTIVGVRTPAKRLQFTLHCSSLPDSAMPALCQPVCCHTDRTAPSCPMPLPIVAVAPTLMVPTV
jgi:hypothetical protein